MRASLTILAMVAVSGDAVAAEALRCDHGGTPVARVGGKALWRVDRGLVYVSPVLKVDADGAPNSYRVDGNGLSYTCDGVLAIEGGKRITPDKYPRTWQAKCRAAWASARASKNYRGVSIFGFLTDADGAPVVQKQGDPLPDEAFVTTTFVEVPGTPAGTQRHYVDAAAIPYLVLPDSVRRGQSIRAGTVAAVYRAKTGKIAFAVFGDTGGALDEASVRLHQDLGGKPIAKIGGVDRAKINIDDQVVVALFPDNVTTPTTDAEAWRKAINDTGAQALAAWGGEARLKQCRP